MRIIKLIILLHTLYLSIYQYGADRHGKQIIISSDNGIGFPEDLDFRNIRTLGMQLVTNLTKQVKGNIDLDRRNGTEWTIRFAPLE